MDGRRWFEEFGVLLLDDSVTRLALFDDWLPGVRTKLVTSPEDLAAELESSTAVACLSQSLLSDADGDCRKLILNRNPFCQLVSIVPRTGFTSVVEDEYDAWIRRPVFKETLQERVEHGWKCGIYASTLHEFYNLNAELVGDADGAAADGDAAGRERLRTRYREVTRRLDFLQASLDATEIRSTMQSVKLHRHFLRDRPERGQGTETSKYHPARCPECRLPWGVDHRNVLGKGFEPVGAYVWKCARCNEIVHGLGASHRRMVGP